MILRQRVCGSIAAYVFVGFCVSLLAGCASTLKPAPVVETVSPGQNSPLPSAVSGSAGSVGNSGTAATPPTTKRGGAYYQDDGPGDSPPPNLMQTPDAVPKVEPYSKAASRAYEVFGTTYTPITDERAFKQRGIGSWYGKKYHGRRTSSGEVYDMYKMTAAHPTLPIPSYARITSIANGRSVIVRVNDRGPFHSNRIADLSYTAALKLGFMTKGSHEIEIERLLPDEIARILSQPKPAVEALAVARPDAGEQTRPEMVSSELAKAGFYLQLGAYSQAGNAESSRLKLAASWQTLWPALQVVQSGALFRLYSGPFDSRAQAVDVAQQMQNDGIAKALVVQR
jgi:rare lipoprotein A